MVCRALRVGGWLARDLSSWWSILGLRVVGGHLYWAEQRLEDGVRWAALYGSPIPAVDGGAVEMASLGALDADATAELRFYGLFDAEDYVPLLSFVSKPDATVVRTVPGLEPDTAVAAQFAIELYSDFKYSEGDGRWYAKDMSSNFSVQSEDQWLTLFAGSEDNLNLSNLAAGADYLYAEGGSGGVWRIPTTPGVAERVALPSGVEWDLLTSTLDTVYANSSDAESGLRTLIALNASDVDASDLDGGE